MEKCPKCHKEIPTGANFCPYCGASIDIKTTKEDNKPSLDDYLPHDANGAPIDLNANTEGPQPDYTKKEEEPKEKEWDSGSPYYDKEIRQTGEEVRAGEDNSGRILAIIAIATSFFGCLGIPLGIWGLFKAKNAVDRTLDILAIVFSIGWLVILIIEMPSYMAWAEKYLGGITSE
jgi:hypothetical protein